MYNNQHERKCFEVILKCFPDLWVYQSDNSILHIVENRIRYYNGQSPMLFPEAGMGQFNLTNNGREIRKEFLLYFPVPRKMIWIEVKYLSKPTSLRDQLHGEITRSKNYNGELWLLTLGDGFDTNTLEFCRKEIKERNLTDRVRIITNYIELEETLITVSEQSVLV